MRAKKNKLINKNSQNQFFCNATMMSSVQKENEPQMYGIGALVGEGMLPNGSAH